jgi:hypothetical protein
MYRCEKCNEVAPAGARAVRVVAEQREASFPRRSQVFTVRVLKPNGRLKKLKQDDPGGRGLQIVRELKVCPPCAQPH